MYIKPLDCSYQGYLLIYIPNYLPCFSTSKKKTQSNSPSSPKERRKFVPNLQSNPKLFKHFFPI